MSRTGMAVMIDTVRGFCNAGTNDATVGTVVFWADDEVQRVLDRHRTYIVREELTPFEAYAGASTLTYLEYRSAFGNLESGTSVFKIEDATGAAIGTASYSCNYPEGIVTFTADQAGSARFMTTYTYDLYAAAADIWRVKLAHVSDGVDFSTDNMRVNRKQKFENAMNMVSFYERMAGSKVITLTRDDSTILGDD